ncbi:MAG: hypothetical protein WBQ18_10345 [Solirubrobacteraceae bacterium]
MSNAITPTQFQAGDFISESAVHSVQTRRRPGAPVAAAATALTRRRSAPRSGNESRPARPLRRWSVAELIARANGLPRATA